MEKELAPPAVTTPSAGVTAGLNASAGVTAGLNATAAVTAGLNATAAVTAGLTPSAGVTAGLTATAAVTAGLTDSLNPSFTVSAASLNPSATGSAGTSAAVTAGNLNPSSAVTVGSLNSSATVTAGTVSTPSSTDDDGWIKVVSKKTKKANFKAKKHVGDVIVLAVTPQESLELNYMADNVVWSPKTYSRRAAMKWSTARKGGCTGTAKGMGVFIFGSYGDSGLEFYY